MVGTMAITALHRALGRDQQGFTFDMIDQAVEEGVEEQTQLDWKSTGPPPKGAPLEAELELVKDLAAMANSGGGVIVYGIQEKSGDRAQAVKVVDVGHLDEAGEKRLRQLAWSMIHPPINVRWHPLTNDAGDLRVIVAEIPDSITAPHMITRKNEGFFGVPWRDGPHTRWMDEPAIAAAYTRRLDAQHRQLQDIDDRATALAKSLPHGELDVWVSAVAIPYGITRKPSMPIDYEATSRLLSNAWGRTGHGSTWALGSSWESSILIRVCAGSSTRRSGRSATQAEILGGKVPEPRSTPTPPSPWPTPAAAQEPRQTSPPPPGHS